MSSPTLIGDPELVSVPPPVSHSCHLEEAERLRDLSVIARSLATKQSPKIAAHSARYDKYLHNESQILNITPTLTLPLAWGGDIVLYLHPESCILYAES